MYYDEVDSPLGTITLIGDQTNLFSLFYGTFIENQMDVINWCQKHGLPTDMTQSSNHFTSAIHQLDEYFQGKRQTFSISYQLFGTTFQKKVWHALIKNVPFGDIWSYKDLAEQVGSPKAVRAIGGAMNKNPISIIVPCHRVIGTSGKLVGYGSGVDKKQYLLQLEKGKS
ncbi:O6-methylguanine DNA alkyltransferase [Gracilibacillus halophilus YIM-C55.5]|uniref:Methylated-DNA--protein-cysteine methyltransferase n=1 Tax=Gracilibacillus halophilus YIM-C55.5 TaxID=1308866 RepID=N4W8M2_9BACI|nr:methylated-DNA--[protein]-cysteine S-methyltransferase [Gracilibacillus halophilus]ENH96623.1 O6-methylguanine DNA alkyltransferase [Gracilibacillus halophilus YIM-C55.5]